MQARVGKKSLGGSQSGMAVNGILDRHDGGGEIDGPH